MARLSASVSRSGANRPGDVALVQTLLQTPQPWLKRLPVPAVLGRFSPALERAIRAFHRSAGALAHPDEVVSPNSPILWHLCWSHPPGGLTPADFQTAAKPLDREPVAFQAVAQTELRESSGRPAITDDRYRVRKLTRKTLSLSHPGLCAAAALTPEAPDDATLAQLRRSPSGWRHPSSDV